MCIELKKNDNNQEISINNKKLISIDENMKLDIKHINQLKILQDKIFNGKSFKLTKKGLIVDKS